MQMRDSTAPSSSAETENDDDDDATQYSVASERLHPAYPPRFQQLAGATGGRAYDDMSMSSPHLPSRNKPSLSDTSGYSEIDDEEQYLLSATAQLQELDVSSLLSTLSAPFYGDERQTTHPLNQVRPALQEAGEALQSIIGFFDALREARITFQRILLDCIEQEVMQAIASFLRTFLSLTFVAKLFEVRTFFRQFAQEETGIVDPNLVDIVSIALGHILDFIEDDQLDVSEPLSNSPGSETDGPNAETLARILDLQEPHKWARRTLDGTATRTAMLAFVYADALISHEKDLGSTNVREGADCDLDAAWIESLVMSLPNSSTIPMQHAVFALYLLAREHALHKRANRPIPFRPHILAKSLDMLATVLNGQADNDGLPMLLVCSSHGKVVLPWITEETRTNGIPAEAVHQLVSYWLLAHFSTTGLAGEGSAITLPPGLAAAASVHSSAVLEDVIDDIALYEPHLTYLLDRALQSDASEPKLLDSLASLAILLIHSNDCSGSKFVAYAARTALLHLSASQGSCRNILLLLLAAVPPIILSAALPADFAFAAYTQELLQASAIFLNTAIPDSPKHSLVLKQAMSTLLFLLERIPEKASEVTGSPFLLLSTLIKILDSIFAKRALTSDEEVLLALALQLFVRLGRPTLHTKKVQEYIVNLLERPQAFGRHRSLHCNILAGLYIRHARVLQDTSPAVALLVAHHLRTQAVRSPTSAKALDAAELLALRTFLASTSESMAHVFLSSTVTTRLVHILDGAAPGSMQGQLHEELQNAYICLSAGRWKDRAPEANEKVARLMQLLPVGPTTLGKLGQGGPWIELRREDTSTGTRMV